MTDGIRAKAVLGLKELYPRRFEILDKMMAHAKKQEHRELAELCSQLRDTCHSITHLEERLTETSMTLRI